MPEKKIPQSTILVQMAADVELFHTSERETFAAPQVVDHVEIVRLQSAAFRQWLSHRFFLQEGHAPSAQAMQDALAVLSGRALFECAERKVYVRTASIGDNLYLDLGGPSWEVVELAPTGWRIVDNPRPAFWRPRGMLPLPMPERGGTLEDLRPFLNVGSEADWQLITGCLLAMFRDTGPFPVLVFHGEQGSAKSTLVRVLRSLVDPVRAPLRSVPRNEQDLSVAARNGWIVALDNVSFVADWLSDAICRLSTGGGWAGRELYTNLEEAVFEGQRPVILNGIEELGSRGDLIDRSVAITLPRINDNHRLTERAFWRQFEVARPGILGALLDIVCAGLKNLPSVHLDRLPRMADFSLWATACEPATGWTLPFIRVYEGNRADANTQVLESSPVARFLLDVVTDSWQGTASELLVLLDGHAPDAMRNLKSWPKSGQALSNQLRRLQVNLRNEGLVVTFTRGGERGAQRMLTLEKVRGEPTEPPEVSDRHESADTSNDLLTLADAGAGTRKADYLPTQAPSDTADAADAVLRPSSDDCLKVEIARIAESLDCPRVPYAQGRAVAAGAQSWATWLGYPGRSEEELRAVLDALQGLMHDA